MCTLYLRCLKAAGPRLCALCTYDACHSTCALSSVPLPLPREASAESKAWCTGAELSAAELSAELSAAELTAAELV